MTWIPTRPSGTELDVDEVDSISVSETISDTATGDRTRSFTIQDPAQIARTVAAFNDLHVQPAFRHSCTQEPYGYVVIFHLAKRNAVVRFQTAPPGTYLNTMGIDCDAIVVEDATGHDAYSLAGGDDFRSALLKNRN